MSKIPRKQLAIIKQAMASAHAWRAATGTGRAFAACNANAGAKPITSGIANMKVMNTLETPCAN